MGEISLVFTHADFQILQISKVEEPNIWVQCSQLCVTA